MNHRNLPEPVAPRPNRLSRWTVVLSIVATTFILLTAAALAIFSFLDFTTELLYGSDDQETLCNTPSCEHLAAALGRRSLNSSANPCFDFYHFACETDAVGDVFETSPSKILNAARDLITFLNVSNNQRLLQKASTLYRACGDVRRERRKDAKSLLFFLKQRRLELALDSDVEPLDAALSLDLRYGLKTLFDVSVVNGLLSVGRRNDLDRWVESKKKMINDGSYLPYVDYIFEVLNQRRRVRSRDIVDSILKTEDLVLTLHSRNTEDGRSKKVFLVNATESLVIKRPEWKIHLQKHFERVALSGPSMLNYLDAIFAQSPSASLVLYVVWEVIRQMAPFADHRLMRPDEDFDGTGRRCFEAIMRVMDVPILASVLVQDVSASAISSARSLFNKIAESLAFTTNASWLQEVTLTIVNPGDLLESHGLHDRYEDVGELHQPFLLMYLRTLAIIRQQDLENLDAVRVDVKSADLLGHDLIYDRQRNVVTLPTSLLRPPFFAEDAPSGIGFGGLGRVIVRGLGSQLPKNGTAASCLRRMAGENVGTDVITDAVYLDTLYRAFMTKRKRVSLLESANTHQQESLFFVAFCHLWCHEGNSTPMACNLPLMNSAKFAHAFSCPVGSVMTPVLSCSGRSSIPSVLLY